jgi:hypothetical protein
MSDEVVSVTADFSCRINIFANFPPFQFTNQKLYFHWSTEFTKGESTQSKIDSKGITQLVFPHVADFSGDVKWNLTIDTTSDGTEDSLVSSCTMKFFKV